MMMLPPQVWRRRGRPRSGEEPLAGKLRRCQMIWTWWQKACNTNVKNGTKNGKIAMLPNDLDLITESLQYKCQKMVPKTGKLRRCQVIWTWWQKAYNTNVKKWYQKWENCNVVKWFWLDARKSAIQISQNGIWLFKRTIFCLIFSFSSVIQIINS